MTKTQRIILLDFVTSGIDILKSMKRDLEVLQKSRSHKYLRYIIKNGKKYYIYRRHYDLYF